MTAYSGIRCVPVVLCAAAVHACAARTALNDYRRAVIDRPFTLPAGVDSFHVGILGGYARDDFNSAGRAGAPVGWDLSLSDDSTLHLSPLQLGISRQRCAPRTRGSVRRSASASGRVPKECFSPPTSAWRTGSG